MSRTVLIILYVSAISLGLVFPAAALPATNSTINLLEATELWSQRQDRAVQQKAILSLEEACSRSPDNYELHWALARALYWEATQVSANESAAFARRGWESASRAIAIDPLRVEGQYWAAVNAGQWSEAVGIPRAIILGLTDKFETPAKAAYAIDPSFDSGGPARVLGRFYTTIPWPFRDLDKAALYLDEAVNSGQLLVINHYFRADVFRRAKQPDNARQSLETALLIAYTAGDIPQNDQFRPRAQALLKELQ
jgi:hypothetical protein